ncbi:hypothetical protein V1282_006444 [Nitrobacteraceae bacterium AZCC 2146]
MRRLAVEWDGGPAGVGGTYPCALGRPWVTVRAYYEALPLRLAGRGTGEGGEIPPDQRVGGSHLYPEERSQRPKSPIAAAGCVNLPAM